MAAVVRQRPTRRQLEVLRAYIATGSISAAAADELGIACTTARQHLSGLVPPDGAPERRAGGLQAGRRPILTFALDGQG